jgi:hypothetical protein
MNDGMMRCNIPNDVRTISNATSMNERWNATTNTSKPNRMSAYNVVGILFINTLDLENL